MNPHRLLVVMLRAVAAAAMFAIVPVFMPHAWMDAVHSALGLGELPRLPVIVYLTRSLSAMYVFHGGMLWLIAGNPKHYATLVTYTGIAFIAFGLVSLWIDSHAGLPWFWIAAEGPFALAFGAAVLWLQQRTRQAVN